MKKGIEKEKEVSDRYYLCCFMCMNEGDKEGSKFRDPYVFTQWGCVGPRILPLIRHC